MVFSSLSHDNTTQLVLQTIDAYERSAKECVVRWNKRRPRRPSLLVEWLEYLPAGTRVLGLGCGGGGGCGRSPPAGGARCGDGVGGSGRGGRGGRRAISTCAGIALWVWTERARCSQPDAADIVHCRWSVPTSASSPFMRCRSMGFGLPPR